MDRKSAEMRAVKIASDIQGPLGRVPLERVFSKYIDFFSELKAAGATWPQIAALLNHAGITRKDGRPMTASQVRATISRIVASTDPKRFQAVDQRRKKLVTSRHTPHEAPFEQNSILTPQPKKHSDKNSNIRTKMSKALKARELK